MFVLFSGLVGIARAHGGGAHTKIADIAMDISGQGDDDVPHVPLCYPDWEECPVESTFALTYKDADGNALSPWHDLPWAPTGIHSDGQVITMVTEIPAGSNAKMECKPDEEGNPIVQDTKSGKIRYVVYEPYPANYGFVPQTVEDPCNPDPWTGLIGDKDPIDIFDIAPTVPMGTIATVRVLGALAMVDDMETDWKVFAISTTAECTKEDIEERIAATYDFLLKYKSYYKTEEGELKPDGDNLNTFYDKSANDGTLRSPASLWAHKDSIWYNAEEAMELIKHGHTQYKKLFNGDSEDDYCGDWDDYKLTKSGTVRELSAEETCPMAGELGPVAGTEDCSAAGRAHALVAAALLVFAALYH